MAAGLRIAWKYDQGWQCCSGNRFWSMGSPGAKNRLLQKSIAEMGRYKELYGNWKRDWWIDYAMLTMVCFIEVSSCHDILLVGVQPHHGIHSNPWMNWNYTLTAQDMASYMTAIPVSGIYSIIPQSQSQWWVYIQKNGKIQITNHGMNWKAEFGQIVSLLKSGYYTLWPVAYW